MAKLVAVSGVDLALWLCCDKLWLKKLNAFPRHPFVEAGQESEPSYSTLSSASCILLPPSLEAQHFNILSSCIQPAPSETRIICKPFSVDQSMFPGIKTFVDHEV